MLPTPCRSAATALILALAAGPASAGDGAFSPVESGSGIGAELAGVHRSMDVAGIETNANGSAGGIHAFFQHGPWLRIEGRALAGGLDYEVDGRPDRTESIAFWGLRATGGVALDQRTRLFAGLGVDRLGGDSPFGSGVGDVETVYLPVGVSRVGYTYPNWRALVALEGRYIVYAREEIDNIPAVGDVEFSHTGGLGVALSISFRRDGSPLAIEPYIAYNRLADSDTERVAGQSVRIENAGYGRAGVRLDWRF